MSGSNTRRVVAILCALAVALTVGAASAQARCTDKNGRKSCTDTLSSAGGWAHVTKRWWGWDGRSYHASYRATLHDRKGDGRHLRLYVYSNGAPLGYRRATFGRTVRVRSGLLDTRRLTFRLCTYNRGRQVYCGAEW